MPKSATFSIFLILALLFLPAKSVEAQQATLFQELGAFYTVSSSDNVELPSPLGVGVYARWQFAGSWLFRLSYHRFMEETSKEGVVCDQYAQRINCRVEPTETDVTFSGLRGALYKAFRVGNRVEVGLGSGLSFNHVNPDARDLTGWPADMLVPNTGQIGVLLSGSAALAPFRRIPILLNGGFTNHWVNFNGCSGEDPPQYDPFCGWEPVREIEFGLSFVF